ncbi:hypothetical protein EDD37DRAFT_674861 [Exophiala viscosa]|uniref:Uncharacterized protein n=1 Tax=Exophiala viscosa TaxID=2486360 RepID=A0AAN6DKA3_9EURO|nr:hypothetical protein EDD36DRAFT_106242 [Exophiala viscosa]KAI1620038.1 hypothetical protein EDD37DRAFT_674861 [Exophiala viscosa]
MSKHEHGLTLSNGTTITHGDGANIKRPFTDVPVVMHEFDPGTRSFAGQFGFIEFTTEYRLPRHVHIAPPEASAPEQKFTCERIVVLNGVALVELNGEIYVIPPKSLVTIAPGVPHTWTACPAGVSVIEEREEGPQVVLSEGKFLMLYEYEEPTSFFPTKQVHTMKSVHEYERCDDLESIRIPKLSVSQVYERCFFAWGRSVGEKDEHGSK